MKENFNFVGKNLSNSIKEKSSKVLKAVSSIDNIIPKRNEIRKNAQELKMISLVNDMLNHELASMDLPPIHINPQQVHLYKLKHISSQMGEKNELQNDIAGGYNNFNQRIVVNVERTKDENAFIFRLISSFLRNYQEPQTLNQENFLRYLTHESNHHDSFHSFFIDVEKNIKPYRVGYDINNEFDESYKHRHFQGFNEAVVERTTEEILQKNFPVLKENFDLKAEILKQSFSNSGYIAQIMVLSHIINGIAESKHLPIEKVWEKIKKGQFSGDMMHLRDIEEVYGPGSLRILASLDDNPVRIKTLEKYRNYFDFFNTNLKLDERKKIGLEILKNLHIKEQEAYKNHVNKLTK